MPPRRWVAPRSRCCSWDRRWPPSLAPASAAGLRCGPAAPRPARSSSSSPPDAARPPRHLIRCTNLRRGTCLCCRMSTTLTRGQSCRPLFVNTDLSQACAVSLRDQLYFNLLLNHWAARKPGSDLKLSRMLI
ncbi:uncharacterized protein [Miscanthus floridulus]|uniref:uncharacterized protein isoform X2 n=1 Tax=Miscanthus floridulus TaxID=154761 RepID=UPI00345B3852